MPGRGGETFLRPQEVIPLIEKGVVKRAWPAPLRALTGSHVGEPWLVHRIDHPSGSRDYFLAAVTDPTHTQIRALAMVDGHDPANIGAFHLDSPASTWLISYAMVKSLVVKEADRLGLMDKWRKGLLHQPHEGTLPEPPVPADDLFWRPCHESYSPFLPFFKVHYLGVKFFVRIDGQFVRRELWTAGRGD
jgi:hypothetical protein